MPTNHFLPEIRVQCEVAESHRLIAATGRSHWRRPPPKS